jgi:UDP-N-acetyl-D-mannosaminuronic acid dehydrogenase
VAGHDFVVPAARVAALGYQPVSLEDGLRDANAMMVLVDHPGYSTLQPSTVAPAMRPPAVVFDMWGVLRPAFEGCKRVRYLRWGRG